MTKTKTILLAVFAILAVIVAVQNTQSVETKLLFVSVWMPRVVLLLVTLLIGVAVGLIAGMRIAKRDTSPGKPAA